MCQQSPNSANVQVCTLRTHLASLYRRCREVLSCSPSLALVSGSTSAALDTPDGTPHWLNNDLGREEIVLPGFSPVRISGHRVELGGHRSYEWSNDLLPTAISSQGEELVNSMELVVVVNGAEHAAHAVAQVISSVDHHAELRAISAAIPGVSVDVRSRVEYDGVTVVDVEISSATKAVLDRLDLRFTVPRRQGMKTMAFDPATMYNFRPFFIPDCYRGSYKSTLGFVYGNASFWWFDDDLDRSLLGDSPVTTVRCDGPALRVSQPLLARSRRLDAALHFRFGFLATPVRDLPGSFRVERYTSRDAPEEGNRNLWWIDATAHYALPYLEYPPGAKERLPPADINAYPGAARNRASVQASRILGLERLPYISLRTLSFLDPIIDQFQDQWQVMPPIRTEAPSDAPYRIGFPRAILSHRGPGFSDYLLSRLNAIADGLQVRGFYFDQGSTAGSTNAAQLLPDTPPGSASTDILATREFFKRLATLIYKKGMSPLIYVHNSSAPIVPAFTFATSMVQGEELLYEVHDLDYQGSLVDLDRIRANYAPGAFGVPTIWLEELWSEALVDQRPFRYRFANSVTWLASDEYYRKWRNFMALALLHDIPVWTVAPIGYRRQVYRQLDQFGVTDSRFVGYWDVMRWWRESSILVSAYAHKGDGRTLLIVANRDVVAHVVDASGLDTLLNWTALSSGAGSQPRSLNWSGTTWTVPARDFMLIESR
jgi:hypothetical protein